MDTRFADLWLDVVGIERADPLFAPAALAALRAALLPALDTLKPKERDVLILRYGLGADGPRTFHRIAEALSLSPERIRQIQLAALRKLRHPTRWRPVALAIETADKSKPEGT